MQINFGNHYAHSGISAENVFSSPLNSSCACPNQNLTFQCTITGDGATIWGGSAFSCAGSGNEIILRHNSFAIGTSKECNGGAIFGQSLVVQSDQYTSQLFVNVSTELNSRTVRCTSNFNIIVGEAVIIINTGIHYYYDYLCYDILTKGSTFVINFVRCIYA